MVHAGFAQSLMARPPGLKVSRPPLVRLRYGLVTRHHPSDGVVGRLQNLGLPRSCYPSYGAPTSTPVGLTPTERASLRWTHNDCFVDQELSLTGRLRPERHVCLNAAYSVEKLLSGSRPKILMVLQPLPTTGHEGTLPRVKDGTKKP